jgi:uncharacterized coiled-coil protein SlyX
LEGSLTPEGGAPYDGGMEARVARLEAGVSDIKMTLARLEPVLGQMSKELGLLRSDLVDIRSDLKDLRSDVTDLRSKDLVDVKVAVAKLEGRVSQLPTTVQMLGFIFIVLAAAGVTKYLGI